MSTENRFALKCDVLAVTESNITAFSDKSLQSFCIVWVHRSIFFVLARTEIFRKNNQSLHILNKQAKL